MLNVWIHPTHKRINIHSYTIVYAILRNCKLGFCHCFSRCQSQHHFGYRIDCDVERGWKNDSEMRWEKLKDDQKRRARKLLAET